MEENRSQCSSRRNDNTKTIASQTLGEQRTAGSLLYPWLPRPQEDCKCLVRDYSDRSTLGHVLANETIKGTSQVGNIPYEATEEKLKDIFSEVGPVLSFKLVYDRETGKPKGYGFCEYKDQETALSAMRNLNGYEIGGRTLRVDNACTEKSRMEMQSLLQGPTVEENPYGEAVQAEKAPEAISKAVASLPPEQMFELMKQMKMCVQSNPNEARTMLLRNPQLAYALLQAQVVMRIVDPHVAVSMLHKANPVPQVYMPSDKPSVVSIPTPVPAPIMPAAVPLPVPIPTPVSTPVAMTQEDSWPAASMPAANMPPLPTAGPNRNMPLPAPAQNPPPPVFGGGDVDHRTMDLRMSRSMGDQDLRIMQPVPPTIIPQQPIPVPPQSRDPRELREAFPPEQPSNVEAVESITRYLLTFFFSFPRDPRSTIPERFPPRDPRERGGDPRDRVGDPRERMEPRDRIEPRADPRDRIDPRERMDPRERADPRERVDPRTGSAPVGVAGPRPAVPAIPGMGPRPNPIGMGLSGSSIVAAGASDQEKAALIMQVLQLSDEQIAMLPPEQRQSILVLKEQIAKSTQRP
uniref:RRM domain-containing protein n=1 Tax=Timema bartmani TaxID=61472 RepID=A0A7R9I317_9NEOP|nr:unnamed protein product [Timema bartmani]